LTVGIESYDSSNIGSLTAMQPDFSDWMLIASAVDVSLTSDASAVSEAYYEFVM
jgi:hypothetical protein